MFMLGSNAADRVALVDSPSGTRLSYAGLTARVVVAAEALAAPRKELHFVLGTREISTVVAYLASIEAGHAVAWIDSSLRSAAFERLVHAYRPERVLAGCRAACHPGAEYQAEHDPRLGTMWRRQAPVEGAPIHPGLACLLSTSGSTGSRKLVRLRRDSLESNARAIVQTLGLSAADVTIASLPIAHAFGLSILDSHLAAGGTVVLAECGVLENDFWRLLAAERATSLAGVPFTFELLRALDSDRLVPPGVATLIQAGGRLALDHVKAFRVFMARRGGTFRVMYGQTEATARISVWPDPIPDGKIASVGRVIPGGEVRIDGGTGEILYRGPNVMMGYAESRGDLALGDEVGELRTGDLGRLDDDGYLFITGRTKRIAKVAGLRFNLDEVEALVEGRPAAAVEHDGRLTVFVETAGAEEVSRLGERLAQALGLDRRLVSVRATARLPRSSAGKVLYPELE